MLCPACGGKIFSPVKLDAGLPVARCADCSGVWVELEVYRIWRKTMPDIAALEYAGEIEVVDDATRMCPKTGRMMVRVRVRNEIPLRLDFSPAAQGVWLDRGEWKSLLALGLHHQLDAIVSERWQRELQAAASRERLEKTHRTRFGDAVYDELIRIRHWLQAQPNSAEMIAFLNARAE